MPDFKAALTRKLGPLPVYAWAGIIGGGVLVAKFVGIGGGGGAPAGESVTVGAGGTPFADLGSGGTDGGGGGGDVGGGIQDPIDIPGVPDFPVPVSGDLGDWVALPPDWSISVPQLPTITPPGVPVPSQPAIPTPGVTPPATGVQSTLQALIARVEFLREHEGAAATAYRSSNPIPAGETIVQRIARLTAEAAALTAARIKRLSAEVTTLRSQHPIAAKAWRDAHPIPATETPEQRERRLTAEVLALRSATR